MGVSHAKVARIMEIARGDGYAAEDFDYGMTVGIATEMVTSAGLRRMAVRTPRPPRDRRTKAYKSYLSFWEQTPEKIAAEMITALEDWKRHKRETDTLTPPPNPD